MVLKSLLASLCLLLLGCADSERVAKLETEIAELKAKQQSQNLQLQEQCSKQARTAFQAEAWEKGQLASFTNHYNAKVNKCFMEIIVGSAIPIPSESRSVTDAFENRAYANYYWANPGKQKYWEVPPRTCKVTTLSGAEVQCKSSDEFDAAIKEFMEQ